MFEQVEELFEIDVMVVEAYGAKAKLYRTKDHGLLWVPNSVLVEDVGTSILVPLWWVRKKGLDVDPDHQHRAA